MPAEVRLWPSDDDDNDDDDQMIATFLFPLIGAGWYPGCYAMGSLPRLVVNLKPFSASIYFQGLSQLCFCLPPWQRSHFPSSLSSSPPLPTSLEFARLKKIPQQCLESGLEEWRQWSFSALLWSWHTPPSPSTWATMKMIDMKNGIEESRSRIYSGPILGAALLNRAK